MTRRYKSSSWLPGNGESASTITLNRQALAHPRSFGNPLTTVSPALQELSLAKLEELRKDLDVAMESENQHRIESLIRQIESLEVLTNG